MKKLILLMMVISPLVYAADESSQDRLPLVITIPYKYIPATELGKGTNIENIDVSTTVITKKEIEKSPELTVDQILNRQMGISLSHTSSLQIEPTSQLIGMRGLGNTGGEKVLVMVDGVPINDGFFKTIDWNQIPKDTIEKIEIVRGGGGGVLWGNLAEGGVINIITKEPVANERKVGFAYGSFNTKVGDASATLYSSDNLKVSANANVIESDGYNTVPIQFRSNPGLVSTESKTHNGLLSMYFTPSDTEKYYLKLSGHEMIQDTYNYSIAKNNWYKYDARSGGEIRLTNTQSVNFNTFVNYSNIDKINGSLVNVNGNSGLKPNYDNLTSIQRAGVMPAQDESMNYQSYGGSVFMTDYIATDYGKFKDIKYGVDARGTTINDLNHLMTQVRNTSATPYVSSIFDIDGQNMFEGVFGQFTFTPDKTPLDITVGLREDFWQAYNGNIANTFYNSPIAISNPGAVKSIGNYVPKNHYFDQFNPRLGLKYSFDNGISLRSALYRNFAAPGMNYQYRTTQSATVVQMGNPMLEPETNVGKEIGIDYNNKDIKVQFTLFHNNLSNYINTMSICGASYQQACNISSYGLSGSGITQIKQSMNIGEATMEGGEVFVEWKANDDLTLNASATKTIAFIDSFNTNFASLNNAAMASGASPLLMTSRQIPYVPDVVLMFGGRYNFTPELSVGWSVKNWSTYYTNTVPNSSYINSGATTADMSVNYQAAKNLELYATGQNISNAYYINRNRDGAASFAAEVGMPRAILGGFKLSF